ADLKGGPRWSRGSSRPLKHYQHVQLARAFLPWLDKRLIFECGVPRRCELAVRDSKKVEVGCWRHAHCSRQTNKHKRSSKSNQQCGEDFKYEVGVGKHATRVVAKIE